MQEFESPGHWDTAAQHYEKTAHPFTARFAEAALARITLTPDSDVLDVATGTGALALAAARTPLLVRVARQKIVADDFRPRAEVRTLRRFVGPHCCILRDADQFE